jgi:2'-5' RNA ligase
MRIFIAIDLAASVQAALADLQRALRAESSSARWVAPESIHLTLRFLGEIPPPRVEEVAEAMVGLAWKPFEVRVHGVGFFPGALSPRVLWAGITASSLQELAAEVDARMNRMGFEPEQRAFRPHLTLARASETRLEPGLTREAKRFSDFEFGSFTADRVVLYESVLEPTGPHYRALKEYLFVSDAGRQ